MMVKIEKLERLKMKPQQIDMADFFGFRIISHLKGYQMMTLHDSRYFYFFYIHMN